jgi:hypothetical protein
MLIYSSSNIYLSGRDLTLGYVKTWIKKYNVDWWGIQNGISLHQIGGV